MFMMGAGGVRGGSWNESPVDTQGMTTWVGEIFCQITEVLKNCLVPETQLTVEGKMRDTFKRWILYMVFIWCRYDGVGNQASLKQILNCS